MRMRIDKGSFYLPGYEIIEIMDKNQLWSFLSAVKKSADLPVLIRTRINNQASGSQIFYPKNGSEKVQIDGILKTVTLERYKSQTFFVEEFFHSLSLETLLKEGALDIMDCVNISIKLAAAIEQLHTRKLIHKYIHPANILIQMKPLNIRITGVESAGRLTYENFHPPMNLYSMREHALFISPEQTGRLNRFLDERSDLYSLGAIIYQMITGVPPFNREDPVDVVHAHIAKVPVSPIELDAKIPLVLSNIVMKLLEKMPEDRYQSASGLKEDLLEFKKRWALTDRSHHFLLGKKDIPPRLDFGEKLFGRDDAKKKLMDALHASCSGQSTFTLVSGESGVGKTALVHTIRKPLVKYRGYFISGKFDLLKKQVPYAPLVQAFQDLFKQLLSEGEERISHWKELLESELQGYLSVIASIIPEIQWIVGEQKKPELITVLDIHNRFRHSFDKLVTLFANENHPLVLFLDDLQWADQATIELIQYIVFQSSHRHLLLMGAYRQNEISENHPLQTMLQKLNADKGVRLMTIPLRDLEAAHMRKWLKHLLSCSDSEADNMSSLMQRITQGNPFFTRQLLQAFYFQRFISLDQTDKKWSINFNQLNQMNIAEDIVNFIVERFSKLPAGTQDALKLASCLGNQFELSALSAVYHNDEAKTAKLLWSAIEEGLILPIDFIEDFNSSKEKLASNRYQFLHDKVQQAIYSTMTLTEREKSHLTIARLIAAYYVQQNTIEKNIFEIVNHFNQCHNLLKPDEKVQLAEWNTIAGQKAREGAAFEAAFSFYKTANTLLGKNGWRSYYHLAAKITVGLGELAYTNNQFTFAEEKFDEALAAVKSREEKLEIYNLKMTLYTHLHRVDEAVDSGLKALQLYGWKINKTPGKLTVAKEWLKIRMALRKHNEESLKLLPAMKSRDHKLVMQTFITMNAAAYHVNQNLASLLMLKAFHFTLKHGTTEMTPLVYNNYALILSAGFARYDESYTFGRMASILAEESKSAMLKGRAYFVFASFVNHWKSHISNSEQMLELSQKHCIESGNFHLAGANSSFLCLSSFLRGHSLQETASLIERQRKFSIKIQYTLSYDFLYELNDWIKVLSGRQNEINWDFAFKTTDQSVEIIHYTMRLQLSYLLNEPSIGKKLMKQLNKLVDRSLVLVIAPEYYFYETLWLLRNGEEGNKVERAKHRRRIQKNVKLFEKWMNHSPANYAHKYFLLKAEMARVENEHGKAGEYFELAAVKAAENGFYQDEGIANECAGKFYYTHGFSRLAKVCFTASIDAYTKWGATTKVFMMKETYSNLFDQQENMQPASNIGNFSIDLKSIMSAAGAISSEIVLEKLIFKMMDIVLVNGGAQKGIMLLHMNDSLKPIAEGIIDKYGTRIANDHHIAYPKNIIHYVEKSHEPVILSNAASYKDFASDPYIKINEPKSVLCFPILHQRKLVGIIYLENNSLASAFSSERMEILNIISAQAAISIENAFLYENLEKKVKERTTELEEAYDRLEKANQELADGEKLRREFISNISHDLRSPITAAQGFIEAILDGVIQDKNEQRHYLERSHQRLLTLNDMINDLFELTNLESKGIVFDMKPIQANRLFEYLSMQFEPEITSENLNCSCYIDHPPFENYPFVEVDIRRMEQIVQNLVSNAKRHTKFGEIGFNMSFDVEKKEVLLTVKDTGSGISEEDLPFIFDRFYTNFSKTKGGHGLGLAICKEIVHSHNGEITVESKVNAGTAFTIHLPAFMQGDKKNGLYR